MKFSKVLKIILLAGLSLIVVGGIAFSIAFIAAGGEINFASNRKIEEKTFTETMESRIENVTIDFKNAQVTVIAESESATLSVEYPQIQDNKGKNLTEVAVSATETSLTISEKQLWKYNFWAWDFTTPQVTVHLPVQRTYALSLSTDNGNVTLRGDLSVTSVEIDSNNGNVNADGKITCTGNIHCSTDNGNVVLGNVVCASLTAESDNGNVCVSEGNVNGKAVLETDNGKVIIDGYFKANVFEAETNNGEIRVNSGTIEAETITLDANVGEITAKIVGKKTDFTVTVEHNLGETNIHSQSGGTKKLYVSNDIGEIEISFTEA